MLATKLSIPVIRKDDITDALKSSKNITSESINNEVCYNILYKLIQTNLDLRTDFILDIALGDRSNATYFLNRFNFHNNNIVKFFLDCTDENEWKNRHMERLKNPLPHQSFQSLEHIFEHYNKADVNPFEDEYFIDSANSLEKCFTDVISVINNLPAKKPFV